MNGEMILNALKNIWIFLFFVIIIFLFLNKYESNVNAKTQENIKEIKIVIDDKYPPYVFRDTNGELQGIIIDQWKLWEKKTGIKAIINAMDWNNALEVMKNEEYDVIDTMFANEERSKVYDFSSPSIDIEVPIFFQKNIYGVNDINSLRGFQVAVKKGDFSVDFLKKRGINNLKEYDSYESLIEDAKDQKISIFVMDKPPAFYYIYKMGIGDKFKYSNPLYTGQFRRAVKKGNTEMMDIVENGFSLITKSEYKQIDKKWLGDSNVNIKYIEYIKILSIIIAIVLLFSIVYNYILKKTVKNKTEQLVKVFEDLKISEKKYRELLSNLRVGVAVHSTDGQILMANKEYFKLFGMTEKELKNEMLLKTWWPFIKENGEALSIEEYPAYKALKNNVAIYNYTMGIKAFGKGETVWVEVDAFPQYNSEKSLKEIVTTLVDITNRKKSQAKIYEMSIYDNLTRLYNRNYFENELNKFKRKSLLSIGIVMCDLDGLKLINDTLGHHIGDDYLRIVADILRSCFRKNDLIARIGGDEFAIIMPNATLEHIKKGRYMLYNNIKKLNNSDRLIPISVSFGYSLSNNSIENLEEILKQADNNMYKEKLLHRQSNKNEIVQLLMKMLEARDFITEGHGERLKELGSSLAVAAGMSENEAEDIKLLAQFHDIGKVGIPDRILFKPDKLNAEELAEMKRHTDIGYRIASASPNLVHIADWIFKHHEWWNGKGYPLGIKEQHIPIQCRILSIVDAYDAMTNDRPYRKALTREQAINEIEKFSGKQFDPVLAKKFIEILNLDCNIEKAKLSPNEA